MQKIETSSNPIINETSNLPLPPIQVYGIPEDTATETQWNIRWLFLVFRRRLPIMLLVAIATTLGAMGLVWLRSSLATPRYTGSFELLVEPITAEAQAARQTASSEAGVIGAETVQQSRLDYQTQILILRSPQLLQPVIDNLQTRYPTLPPDVVTQILASNLQVERVGQGRDDEGTRIIRVTYQDQSPEAVAQTLEQLSDIYLDYALEERQTDIDQAIRFIDQQLPELQAQVDDLQARLQVFREGNTLIDPTLEGTQLTQQAGQLQQQRLDSETAIAEARSRYSELLNNDPVAILSEAPEYGTILNLFQELEGQVAVEAARMTDQNPEMQLLQERRANIARLINQEAQRVLDKIDDQIQVLEDRNQSIAQSEREIEQQIRNLPAAARVYDDIQRQLTVATSILTEFSTRQKALQVDAAQQQTPWELINPPTLERDGAGEPRNIAAIDKVSYFALALILGSLLGIGAGLLVELLSDRCYTIGDLKNATHQPILGEIPYQRKLSAANENSPLFLEAFQTLYTKISLLSSSHPVRSLTVSSTVPGEGKSTIAIYLARAAASMGRRVLLIDADFRRPQLHERLELSNQVGLSDLIMKQSVTYEQAIQKRSPNSQLYVLTAGSSTETPIRLLSSNRMRALAEEFSKNFDLVIYDTTPILNLADSSLVATATDGVLMITKLGYTQREKLGGAVENLTTSGIQILGLVANQVRLNAQDAYLYEEYVK